MAAGICCDTLTFHRWRGFLPGAQYGSLSAPMEFAANPDIIIFTSETDNDAKPLAVFLEWRMREGTIWETTDAARVLKDKLAPS